MLNSFEKLLSLLIDENNTGCLPAITMIFPLDSKGRLLAMWKAGIICAWKIGQGDVIGRAGASSKEPSPTWGPWKFLFMRRAKRRRANVYPADRFRERDKPNGGHTETKAECTRQLDWRVVGNLLA